MGAGLVAVVDDDAAVMMMLHEALTDEGYRTLVCTSNNGAHACIRDAQPDVVILDVITVGGDMEWCIFSMLRTDPRTAHIPVLLCTTDAKSLEEHAAFWEGQGCDALMKPFDLQDLFIKLEQLVAQRDAAPPALHAMQHGQ